MKQKPKEKFYVAYGSNLNIHQMQMRCPTAKLYAVGEIKDYELQFKGMPDRAFANKCSVSTVKRAIDELVRKGYVVKENRRRKNGSKTSNVYRCKERQD